MGTWIFVRSGRNVNSDKVHYLRVGENLSHIVDWTVRERRTLKRVQPLRSRLLQKSTTGCHKEQTAEHGSFHLGVNVGFFLERQVKQNLQCV